MAYPVNNVTTANAYTDANTAIFSPPKQRAYMIVTGASVYYRLMPGVGLRALAGQFLPEIFIPPGRYTFNPDDSPTGLIAQLAVRSAVAGTPAQVSIN